MFSFEISFREASEKHKNLFTSEGNDWTFKVYKAFGSGIVGKYRSNRSSCLEVFEKAAVLEIVDNSQENHLEGVGI